VLIFSVISFIEIYSTEARDIILCHQ